MKEMLKKILGFIIVYESVKETKILLKKELKIFKKILFNIIFRKNNILTKLVYDYFNIIPETKSDKLIKEHYRKINLRVLKDIDYEYFNMCDRIVLKNALELRYGYTRFLEKKLREPVLISTININNNPYYEYFVKSRENSK